MEIRYDAIRPEHVPMDLLREIYESEAEDFLCSWMQSASSNDLSVSLGAYDGELPVGFTTIGVHDVSGTDLMLNIVWFAVSSTHHGKNIGSTLLSQSIDAAREHWHRKGYTVRSIIVETEQKNAPALAVYHKVFLAKGFKVHEHVVNHMWSDADTSFLCAVLEHLNPNESNVPE